MAEKLAALEANNTWTPQPLPSRKHPIGCRWIYKVLNYRSDSSVDRYMVQLVEKAYTQHAVVDFLDTFSPVAKL